MTSAENIFLIGSSLVLLLLAILVKKIDWHKLGFAPKSLFKGLEQILAFNATVFVLVQITIVNKFIDLPPWMLDSDPIVPLLAITFLQEIIFRGLLINWLERFGRRNALWGSTALFLAFHLVAPYMWTKVGVVFAFITLVGGYFWGWHFQKFRNVYLLGISHFLVNLSFNFSIVFFLWK